MGIIAVTGATGQVGSELVEALKKKRAQCRLLVWDTKKLNENSRDDAVYFEYSQPDSYSKALDGVSRLFLVCPPTVGECTLDQFMQACKEKEIEQIVFVSGMGADKNPEHFCHKYSKIIEQSEIPAVFLRANWFFQNLRSQRIEIITQDHLLRYPDGQKSISFVDARDIAEVAAYFLTTEVKSGVIELDITGPQSLTHKEVAKLLSKHLPYEVSYEMIPESEAAQELGHDEVWMGLFEDIRNGLVAPVSGDVERILGKPARDFESFIIENKQVWMK